MTDRNGINRRRLLGTGAALLGAGLATPALALQDHSTEMEPDISQSTHHNISAFRELDWQDYFDNTAHGVILCDTKSRALHFWSEDQSTYRLFPTSVPLTDELTKLGRTEVIQKVVNPPWRATQGELERNPDWPTFVAGGDPMNPLGPLALYLSWPAYRIHGTHDTRKIGRRSSNGCIGLYNEHIRQLFDLTEVGTQVILI
ncbi:ErfK/YbiS/YcfS/YnhG family protein/Tat domain protein [Rubellimicrobium mesophilum DSM 19309]|uniref:ErfK/YbiS/YcfS/YnhG family protein/Tat domain protein n=1 Tax=Rubellimicrobium mesophilum DSM 19309 TaxID=442562 RepID=A0A017HMG9_9RHOB|nr:L,D-transpeptidase [Rubellimicrobium mesophilum]EYD75368.1 ErfK/YbiS/YcfS/YnhG family protein/Tat domain protein [Rubellimicrobium mesophilum DSM 19309]